MATWNTHPTPTRRSSCGLPSRPASSKGICRSACFIDNGTYKAAYGRIFFLTGHYVSDPFRMPTIFPFFHSIGKIALSSAQVAILLSIHDVSAGSPPSCPNAQLSCHNTTALMGNTCCLNSPGGQLLQTQFWDTDPATGPADHWTIHGLW